MPKRELHESLSHLRGELAGMQTDDLVLRQTLNAADADIHTYLDAPEDVQAEHRVTLMERLLELEAALEVRFPQLAATVRSAGKILSDTGV